MISLNKVALKNLRIWNGVDDSIDSGVDAVMFENGDLTFVGSSEDLSRESVSVVRDMEGLTMIPGLIDAHVHLCLDPHVKNPLDQDKLSEEEQFKAMVSRAGAMLAAGITSARDLGGGRWLELIIRDRIASGELAGPRLLCAGQPITSPRGHCHFWGGEAADGTDVIKVLTRQIEHGVDLIKVMATGGNITPGSKPVDAQFDQEILSLIVDTAHKHGLSVAAHCHGTAGIRNAAAAGITTIEHCSWVGREGWAKGFDPEVLALITRQGIWVSPTINSGWKRFMGNSDYVDLLGGNYARMREAGVKLIASTDAGIPNVLHHDLPTALPVFANIAGLRAVEALRSATSDCAEAIGLGGISGQIREGYSADFILFDGDPTLNLDVLAAPVQVYKQGEPVLAA
ncbi:MAG: amidohydrolase [Gammaproteobacteria bacterium]|mgnify:CR=1 FL=1|nr:amidohydrolase [Gammaproteobacteria bacterium]